MFAYGKDMINLIDGENRSIEQLKVGNEIWSITPDRNSFIKDEIHLIMHHKPYKTGY